MSDLPVSSRLTRVLSPIAIASLLISLSQVIGTLPVAAATAASWSSAGSMAVPRRDHTATLLNSGQVLIQGWFTTTAELYDQGSRQFSPTGSTVVAHGQGSTATRLADGRVLIVGGNGGPSVAEVYDPATGAFRQTGSPKSPHVFHTATLLRDGRVLVVGHNDNPADVAELYDPSSGTFSLTGKLNMGRGGHAAALLRDGRVLVAGGDTPAAACVTTGELYDPTSGTFTLTPGRIVGIGCTLWWEDAPILADGDALLVGGSNVGDLFEPSTGVFRVTSGTMTTNRTAESVTLLKTGEVLIAGGVIASGPVNTNSAEIYDPSSGIFTATASMATARQQGTATLLPNGEVLVTGGFSSTTGRETASAEVFSLGTTADTIPPTTSASLSPPPNSAGWNKTAVTVMLTAVDEPAGSGVNAITYAAAGAQPIASTTVAGASASFSISGEGQTTVKFFATDNAGNQETPKSIVVRIDTTPPVVSCAAIPSVLWPPDFRLVPVATSVTVSDPESGSAGFSLTSVTMNEPDQTLGAGNQPDDIQGFEVGTADVDGQLRAERSALGTGRLYLITYTGFDIAGNSAACGAMVRVPHDQGSQALS